MLANSRVLGRPPGGVVSFRVAAWELDELDTRPPWTPAILRVRALRIHLDGLEAAPGEEYWDLTSPGLIDQMLVWLERDDSASRLFTLTKLSAGPASRWQLRVEPAPG